RSSPHEVLEEIKEGSLALQGLTEATILRNEGWHFLQAGKYLERADKTSRLLDLRYQTLPERGRPMEISQTESLEWSAILRSCSAWEAFKAIHSTEVGPVPVTEFLLLRTDFPRSICFCVDALNKALRNISGMPEHRFCNDAEKLSGRLRAELQFTEVGEVFDHGLHRYLDQLQARLNSIGEALFRAYIFHPFNDPESELMVQQEEQQQQVG